MKTILAVDDKNDNLISIKAILNNYMPECKVLTARSGQDGIDIAKSELPDTILLDIIMPIMDGYEVCRILKSNDLTRHIPVIMLTAIRTDTESKVKGLESGADAFLTKPIEPNELTAQINVMLRIKGAEDDLRAEREQLDEIVRKRTEELHESRQRLKLFMDSATDVFTLWSKDLTLLEINRVDAQLYSVGWDRSNMIGKRMHELNPRLHEPNRYEVYFNVMKTGKPVILEDSVIDFAGNEMQLTNKIFKAGEGLGIITSDITEQKKAENALRKSEEKLRHIFENAPVGIFQANQLGQCITANSKFAEMIGFSDSELLENNFNFLNLIIDEDEKEKIVETLRNEEQLLDYEIRVKHKTSEVKWIAIFVKTIHASENGNTYFDGFSLDITERKIAEEKSKLQEEQLIAIFDGLGEEVVYVADPDTYEMLYMNNHAKENWGDLIGKKCYKIMQNLDEPCSYCTNHLIFGENLGKTHIWEFKNEVNKRWYRCVDRAIRWPNDKMVRFELAIDITERKKTEEELQKRNEFINSILDKLHIGVAVNTIDDGVTRYMNQAFADIYGWSKDDLVTVDEFWNKVYPDPVYGKNLKEQVMSDIESGDPARMHWEGPIATTKDGEKRIVDCFNISLPSQNLMISTVENITMRKQSEAALRESEEKLRNIFENATNLFFSHTPEKEIIYVSPQVEDMLGYTQEEAEEIWHKLKSENPINKIGELKTKDAMESGKAQSTYELELVHKTGKRVWVEVREAPIVRDGKTTSIVGSLTDITERKQAEIALRNAQEQLHQSQKMEAYGQLAGGIAHDFNNILGAILGYSELIERGVVKNDQIYSKIQNIKSAAKRAADLTRQLLAFSRKQTLQPQIIDLNSIIEDLKKMLKRMIEANIELKTEFDENLKPVLADPGQMGQIIMNLVVNARDAMPNGGSLIIKTKNEYVDETKARFVTEMKSGEYVVLQISDSGCGIDREIKEHIFEPFYTTKEVDKGTGLGLSVVHGIVKQSNGFVSVDSEPNIGTTFTVYLPAIVGKKSRNLITQIHRVNKRMTGTETILIVEDNNELRNLANEILTAHQYKVLCAVNSDEAMDVLNSHNGHINLLLTDIIMPGMSGIDLVDSVKKIHPKIKFVYMSGYADGFLSKMNINKKVRPLLEKPFTMDSLLHVIRETLDS